MSGEIDGEVLHYLSIASDPVGHTAGSWPHRAEPWKC